MLSRRWRTAHRRHSVRALIASTALSAAGGAWSALPDAWIDRLPLWVVLAVPCVISLLGIVGAYLRQPEFD